MKTIGLIGGMSWESTVTYYQLFNRLAREKLGGLHSAKLLLWSFDFADIEAHQAKSDWESATRDMTGAARNLEKGGAEEASRGGTRRGCSPQKPSRMTHGIHDARIIFNP